MDRIPTAPGTVLFDLDGTLLDSADVVHAAWTAALDGMGLPTLPREELRRVIGPPMQLMVPELLAERGVEGEDAAEELVRRFRAAIGPIEVEQARPLPGAVELVEELHEAGRRLAVVTSKPMQAAERVLPALGIAHRFVHLEAPDRARPEPKAETMARAVVALDLDPADTVLVGDRHHDVDAGAAHGIATIGVTWGGFGTREELTGAGAAAVVDHPDELRALLG